MKKNLKLPQFKSEDKERVYWNKFDLSEYFDPQDFERISFPNLKPTTRSISLRVPEFIITKVKEKANEINVPYQSLMKQYIAEGLAEKS
ncbi:MAG: BrnA antitoxin family protein [Patescibacteria group bacterium]